jgi:putative transposase
MGGEVTVPAQVVVSLAEIAESAKEGLLALAVGTGLQVMAAMFEEDVTRLCGPQGKHNADRAGYRHGSEAGSVTLGGRRVPVTRPRVRAADGSGELHLPSYDLFSSAEVLGRLAMEKMLAGLSSRRYDRGLEPTGQAVERAASATTKSAVSRRFVAATETALAELMTRRLDDLERWRDGTMALRWCAAGMLEAGHQFRRVNGHMHLPKLRAALNACFAENVADDLVVAV